VRNTTSFEDAVVKAVNLGDDTDTVACVAGALAGAIYGIQAIPSRWTTYLNGEVNTPNGIEQFDNARLNEISRRLAKLQPPPDAPDEKPAGPAEVEERLFAANRSGASHAPLDWAIVSLCLVGNRFENHKHRREIYLIDQSGDANPDLEVAVNDAVNSIDAFLEEGHNVLVHCHGGRSRTGLILKAWKMKKEGWSGSDGELKAHDWLSKKWDLYRNTHFKDFLKDDWNH
jgi:ADP-ribosyl-[dinitrogen reductase] hydrolase